MLLKKIVPIYVYSIYSNIDIKDSKKIKIENDYKKLKTRQNIVERKSLDGNLLFHG